MQAYSSGFARLYNQRWAGFSKSIAPLILDYYAATPPGQTKSAILDVCCGAGHLAGYFLEKGYPVVGLDLSEAMLAFARLNNQSYIERGQARFVQGDASQFTFDEQFGLVVSTYDALNHLENLQALQGCFQSVFRVLQSGGVFIFDLNTRCGLKRWNSISIDESAADCLVITQGLYDGHGDKAWTRIIGFLLVEEGLYERVDELVYNTVFDLEDVRRSLLDCGWENVHFARLQDWGTPLVEPEKEGRVFIVCRKA